MNAAAEAAWFERTGHCGRCGQPGSYCLCSQPCGCGHLHVAGSGRTPDALAAFAEPAAVADDQEGLF